MTNRHSQETKDKIRQMLVGGSSFGEIARATGITTKAIHGIVRRGREKDGTEAWPFVTATSARNPHEQQTIEDIRRLWGEGLTLRQIAIELDLSSRSAVAGVITRGREKDGEDAWRRPPPQRSKKQAAPKKHRTASYGTIRNARHSGTRKQVSRISAPRGALESNPVRFAAERLGRCGFPIEGEPGPDMLVCGGDTGGDFVYCPYHREVAYQPYVRFRFGR